MPRKPLTDRPTEWKLSIPSSLAARIELRLVDPLTGKPKHGARSRLVNELLRAWLSQQLGNNT